MGILGRNKIIAIAVACVLAGVAYSLMGGGNAKPSKKGKRYGTVKRGDLIQRVTVSGMVHPLRRTVFVAPYDGYIRKLYVKIGEKVAVGSPVVAITTSLASPEQVFPIRAPFGGTVVDIEKMEGEYVGKDEQKKTIVRIDDQSKFFVVAKAAELDASRIKIGMETEVRINAFKHGALKGIVRDIDLAAQEADGWKEQQATFGVKVEVIDPPKELRSGQSAIIDIVTAKFENVLYLEHEFINREGDKNFVIDRKGKRHDIETGRQSDLAMEIVSGLKEGDEAEQIDFLQLLESGT
jgi:multidrug efflux pump subunit AcrA (membrane-fusion protein)